MESSSPLEDKRLGPSVCAPLAQQRLNLTFFTHVAGDREVLCTASHNGDIDTALTSYPMVKRRLIASKPAKLP